MKKKKKKKNEKNDGEEGRRGRSMRRGESKNVMKKKKIKCIEGISSNITLLIISYKGFLLHF